MSRADQEGDVGADAMSPSAAVGTAAGLSRGTLTRQPRKHHPTNGGILQHEATPRPLYFLLSRVASCCKLLKRRDS